jgi:hypothetical protein
MGEARATRGSTLDWASVREWPPTRVEFVDVGDWADSLRHSRESLPAPIDRFEALYVR